MPVGPLAPKPVRTGSLTPKTAPVVTPGTPKPIETAAMHKATGLVDARDVDEFLRTRNFNKQRGVQLPSLQVLLAPPTGAHPEVDTPQLQQHVSQAVQELARVYADGTVTADEMQALQGAREKLDAVAALLDPVLLNLLPKDVRERLQENLVGPVDALRTAAARRHERIVGEVKRTLEGVLANPAPEYGWLQLDVLAQSGGSLSGPDRYAVGDLIAVPRSDGSTSLGVVQQVHADKIVAQFLEANGAVAVKDISAAHVIAANPLKLGDCIDTAEGRVFVTGVSAQGLTGVVRTAQGDRTVDAAYLTRLSATLAEHLAAPTAKVSAPVAREIGEPKVFVAAGGYESKKPEGVRAEQLSLALYTYRGIGYANYNEDGAVIGVIPKNRAEGVQHETGFAGAFDQAGGAGKTGETGAASLIGARRFEEAAAQIAHGEDPEATLRAAVQTAHEQVLALGVGAASTFAAAIVQDNVAHIVNCGDSAVYVFSADGRLKAQTEAHNLGDLIAKSTGDPNAGLNVANVVTTALGHPDGAKADYLKVAVAKGDFIVCVSDGVADANLAAQKNAAREGKPWTELNGDVTTREIGALLKGKPGAKSAELTQMIIDYARDQVNAGKGKKDNVTASVMRVAA